MGVFLTPLRIEEFVIDGESQDNQWVMLAPLVFRADDGRVFTVPRGFVFDLASIPRVLRSVFNVNGKSRAPAALHDYFYCTQMVSREQADDLFREALLCRKVDLVERNVMWVGVRSGGWVYWNKRDKDSLGAGDFVPTGYFKDTDELQYCPAPRLVA